MHRNRPWRVEDRVNTPDGGRTLADLPAGAAVSIIGLDPDASDEIQTRLRHLGFRVGTRVVKLRTAPLGDPAIYRLLGYDTCLRRHEAAYIKVEEWP